jgi:drug/metabolite transporter (DMT)-like permease
MAIVLALLAALLFALGVVLQQRVAAESSAEEAEDPGFLLRLARRPMWILGVAIDSLGYICQAIALAIGKLVVVQPLLAASMVFALPLGVVLSDQRIGRREVLGALAVTVGLTFFMIVSDPQGGRDDASVAGWLVAGGITGGACAALVIAARGRPPALRAALLGAAAGFVLALTAALTKATTDRLDMGLWEVIADWHVYALAVVGYASLALSQASLQTGVLAPAMATTMSVNPLVSLALGTLLLDEQLHESAAGAAVSLLGLVVAVAGLIVLAAAGERGRGDGLGSPMPAGVAAVAPRAGDGASP